MGKSRHCLGPQDKVRAEDANAVLKPDEEPFTCLVKAVDALLGNRMFGVLLAAACEMQFSRQGKTVDPRNLESFCIRSLARLEKPLRSADIRNAVMYVLGVRANMAELPVQLSDFWMEVPSVRIL